MVWSFLLTEICRESNIKLCSILLMQTPFNMLVVDMTACGKTRYLLNLLEQDYKIRFDFIILICPTFSWNMSYQEWKYINDPDFIAIECEQDKVDLILKYVSDVYKGTNSLIMLDDCANGQDVKTRVSELVK